MGITSAARDAQKRDGHRVPAGQCRVTMVVTV
jgi:hypothetical protein